MGLGGWGGRRRPHRRRRMQRPNCEHGRPSACSVPTWHARTMSVPAWMLAPCGWTMAQGIKLAQGSSHGMDARTISMPAWILAPCGWAMAQGSSWLKDQAGSRQAFRSFAIFFSSTVFLLRLGCRSGGPEQNKNIHQVASL